MDIIPIGINIETDEEVGIDLEYLIDQKVQILGNSRSGKSRGARVLVEKSNKKIHQIIISPKKEYVTLREKFDYIHVGRTSELSKPDIELNTRYAEQLALDVMKIGMDVIIEFSEAPKERIKFVKNFVDGLMMVPQKYWHPTMVMIDEIDIWAPEKGHGEAESLGSIVDLAARGADKGYSLVAITQKLAKFNKDVASELNIKLVGNVSLDIEDLGEGPKKMLQAIKMFYPKPASFVQVGAIAGYTPAGGTFGNYQRELKRKNYVTTNGKSFTLTDQGLDATKNAPILPTDTESMFNIWSNKLGAGPTKMLRIIIDNAKLGLTIEKLGELSGFSPAGGTFGNYFRELKRLQLVLLRDKIIIPNPEFFMRI